MGETKICGDCGRELPIGSFLMSRWGKRANVCRECINSKRNDTRRANKEIKMGGEVIRLLFQTPASII